VRKLKKEIFGIALILLGILLILFEMAGGLWFPIIGKVSIQGIGIWRMLGLIFGIGGIISFLEDKK